MSVEDEDVGVFRRGGWDGGGEIGGGDVHRFGTGGWVWVGEWVMVDVWFVER